MCVVSVVNDRVTNYLRQTINDYSIQSYTKLFEVRFYFFEFK